MVCLGRDNPGLDHKENANNCEGDAGRVVVEKEDFFIVFFFPIEIMSSGRGLY